MDDEFEIDLTADAPDDLLPIRWVGEAGHGSTNGNGTVIDVASHAAPRVVTLAPYVPQVPVTRQPAPSLVVYEPDEWDGAREAITLRHAMASRGARFLAVVVVTTFALLLGATVLLWERVEESHQPAAKAPQTSTVQEAELRAVQSRLNRVETRLSSMLDDTQTMVTSPPPSVLEYQLVLLRNCLIEFQRAIDVGRVRGGQFNYC